MKVVVLAQASGSTWMMVNALRATYPDLKVLLEQPVPRLAFLRKRAARMGYWTVFGQVLFMVAVRLLCKSGPARNVELINAAGLSTKRPLDISVREFASVNSADSIAWLASEKPDVVVVNGTRIISTKVLEACNAIFLNTHCGITPGYRGVHGGYWALYSGEPENMGVTVHIVNKGIDTGDIVYQQVTSVDAKDNFLTYPVKQYIAGIPLMLQAINDIRAGRLRTIVREDLRSALWHHPTLWQYLSRRFMRGIR